jgi:hypothetical protein
MCHLIHNVRYAAIPINYALLTTILYDLVTTTLVYDDTEPLS